jgi:hypothetical protein
MLWQGAVRIVGDRLRDWASASSTVVERDAFGRSAFNRYYYAVFLETREMLEQMRDSWKNTAHNNIPRLLETSVLQRVRAGAKQQQRSGLMSPAEHSSTISSASQAACELASLLRTAYLTRVVADYEPETAVSETNGAISLNGHSLDSARNWPSLASGWIGILLNSWRKIGLL